MNTKKPNSRERLLKVATMLYLEPEQDAALRALADRTGETMQVLLRRGVDMVLDDRSSKELKISRFWHDTTKDGPLVLASKSRKAIKTKPKRAKSRNKEVT